MFLTLLNRLATSPLLRGVFIGISLLMMSQPVQSQDTAAPQPSPNTPSRNTPSPSTPSPLDRQSELEHLLQQGIQSFNANQFQLAIEAWAQLLELGLDLGDSPEAKRRQRIMEGAILNNLGEAHRRLGQYQQAITVYEQGLAIAREVTPNVSQEDRAQQRAVEGQVLGNLGSVHLGLGQYQEAIAFSEQQLAIARELSDRDGESMALNNLGEAYRRLGQYPQAIDLYEQSLAITREGSASPEETRRQRLGEGSALGNLASVYLSLGQYQEAIALYEDRLAIARELGDRAGEGITLGNLGLAYLGVGQTQEAIALYQQSLVISQSIGDRAGEATALNNLGEAAHRLGQYQAAIDFFEHSLTISQAIGDQAGEGTALNNLGEALHQLGQYQEAIDFFEQSLAISQAIGNRAGEGITLGNWGNSTVLLGQSQKAIALYEQQLAIARVIGNRAEEGRALGNLGNAYLTLTQYQEAIEVYDQQLDISRDIGYRAGEGNALGNEGLVYARLGDYQQAWPKMQQGLVIDREIGDRTGEAISLSNLGQVLIENNHPELAIIFYKRSVNVRESIRTDIKGLASDQQQAFADTLADDYRTLADLLLQQNRGIEAQEVVDLLKLQELDDVKLPVLGTVETAQGLDFWPDEQAIGDRYDRLIQQNSEADFNDFITHPDIQSGVEQLRRHAQRQTLNPAQLEKLQDNLQQVGNAALLYPLVLDDRIELILVTPSGVMRHTTAVDRTTLNRAIRQFRAALTTPLRSRQTNVQSKQIYDWLIQPLAADLEQAGVDTLLYAADGPLRYIPLAALYDGQQWLIQQFAINHITAASLTDFSQSSDPDFTILAGAFSNPYQEHVFTIGDRIFNFRGLEFAGREVATIANTIPRTQTFFNQEFSSANLEPNMGNHSIIHFATHADFVSGFPHESFILLGNGDRISLRDISHWHLPDAELVVLSACRTAVSSGGRVGNGEEILGFGYQIQQTGAKAAISALWTVNDSGTETLMTAFYTALKNGYSKAEALRRAQISLITDNKAVLMPNQSAAMETLMHEDLQPSLSRNADVGHPYYWAPFILIGNGF